eukprot:CAMPEP_0115306658 /NCGR_PEP_ID=MMETSP0270-20121206/72706_1 /TAXON_ID=71861 /ORGANISM="Scrippsiella trochoidea, Strain CCMP3099" /LENGTH=81 /DNA_ID=CAMNT_0002725011 /DNA_START=44 /DNA_END=286 /DNA_ORIENTATION=+
MADDPPTLLVTGLPRKIINAMGDARYLAGCGTSAASSSFAYGGAGRPGKTIREAIRQGRINSDNIMRAARRDSNHDDFDYL